MEPGAIHEDVEAAALQYVRKISGYRQPSRANQQTFDDAVAEIADTTGRLRPSAPWIRPGPTL